MVGHQQRFLCLSLGLLLGCQGGVHPPEAIAARADTAGVKLRLWAEDVEDARSLALGPQGHVFVGNRGGDEVWALRDQDGDGQADERHKIAEGLNSPNGVAVLGADLYIAEIDAIWRYAGLAAEPTRAVKAQRIRSLPDKTHHGWRYLAAGPDGKLYVAIGAPCNVCEREGFATIERFNPDGSGVEVVARGVRNSVGFDWDAEGVLWFTDNGRDWLGDDLPDCELNRLTKAGAHFGFPYCHAGSVPDPEFTGRDCAEFVPPALGVGPHVAPLGIAVYQGSMFPPEFRGGVFIAEHGSWNRTEKIGYRLGFATVVDGKVTGYKAVIDAWLDRGRVTGRPVDVLELADGSLLVSDDFGDRIWRVSYEK